MATTQQLATASRDTRARISELCRETSLEPMPFREQDLDE